MGDVCRPSGPVSIDAVFELLSHRRRRICLQCLQTHEQALPLADLADEVAVREHETSLDEISAEAVKQIYMSLYHAHIPKLADHGVISYEQATDTVAVADEAEHVLSYLGE